MKTDDEKFREVVSKLDGCREEIEKLAAEFEFSYEQMMEAADCYLATGDYVCLNFNTPDIDWEHFWDLYERVRGVRDPNEYGFFSCAC